MVRRPHPFVGGLISLVLVILLSACGPDGAERAGRLDGAQLAGSLGCVSCHSTNGDRRQGPTWAGLAGSEVTLSNGTTVQADRSYLRRAINDPDAEVVDGFAPIMPDLSLEADQVDAIVTYIEEQS